MSHLLTAAVMAILDPMPPSGTALRGPTVRRVPATLLSALLLLAAPVRGTLTAQAPRDVSRYSLGAAHLGLVASTPWRTSIRAARDRPAAWPS